MGRMGSPALKKESVSSYKKLSPHQINLWGGTGTQHSPFHPQHLPGLTRIGAWRVWPSPDPLGSNWERKKRGRVSRRGAEGEIPLWLKGGFLFPLAPRASDPPAPVKRVPSVMWEGGLGLWAFWPGNRK